MLGSCISGWLLTHLHFYVIYCFSDGGAKPPESCIFGQLLNLSAMFRRFMCLFSRIMIIYSCDI